MFFEESFSAVGKATGQQLESLRLQMGPGVDPAVEHSKERSSPSRGPRIVADDASLRASLCAARFDTEDLRANIMELHGHCPDREREAAAAARRPLSAISDTLRGGRAEADPKPRPSSAFLSRSRGELEKQDVTKRFRAPPVGTYKPNKDACMPRLQSTVPFGPERKEAEDTEERGGGRDLKQLVGDQDIAVELGDIVAKKENHIPCRDFSKSPGRPDFFKGFGIVSNTNTFTAGVLEGDLRCSQSTRQPCYSFSTSEGKSKVQSGYAEPGLYNVKDKLVRPRSGQQNFRFDRQCPRRPLSAPVAPGQNRFGLTKSCPHLSTERRVVGVPDLSKCIARPPITNPGSDCYADSPEAAQVALQRALVTDLGEIDKKLRRRPRTADSFGKSLNRQQHRRSMRIHADDVAEHRMKENLANGPVSVELMADVADRPCFRKPVASPVFAQMPGRELQCQHADPPARRRPRGGGRQGKQPAAVQQFAREARTGETRCKLQQFSHLAGAISELRATRTYEALSAEELKGAGVEDDLCD
mmetsp:Transcript_7613/g.19418  ORF Transcript_7613/g.19418 Transcript_7613/m.19418 type:complete len:530 (+) Transcript_7613:59-1648(+)